MTTDKLQLICILSGGLLKGRLGWRTTTYNDPGDEFGQTGDNLRILAAAHLFKKNKKIKFLICGGKGQYAAIYNCPAISEVMKKELASLGVPKNRIMTEKKSSNTYQQLVFLAQQAKFFKNISLISNDFHLPRIKAFIENYSDLKSLAKIELLPAEKIVFAYDAEQKRIVNKIRKTEKYKKRIKLEKQGIRDIKKGKYKITDYAKKHDKN